MTLAITDAGLAAIGVTDEDDASGHGAQEAPPKKRRRKGKPTKKTTGTKTAGHLRADRGHDRGPTKLALLATLLKRKKGVTIADAVAATGWQAHSVRAAFTGLRKRGVAITRSPDRSGVSVYRATDQ